MIDLLPAIQRRISPEPNSGCWLWTEAVDSHGYGRVHLGRNKYMTAHRAAFLAFVGPIPERAFVCHRCDQPSCVNPDHLFLGDAIMNAGDRNRKRRQARGSRIASSKLSEKNVREIRERHAAGERQVDLARAFGVVRQNIFHIVHSESWR